MNKKLDTQATCLRWYAENGIGMCKTPKYWIICYKSKFESEAFFIARGKTPLDAMRAARKLGCAGRTLNNQEYIAIKNLVAYL